MAKLPEQDKIALEIYEAAIREYERVNQERRYGRESHRRYLGMSQIGDPCSRKLWFDFRGFSPKPKDGRMLLIFDDGDHVEEKLVKYLRIAGYKLENTGKDQLAFRMFDDHFCGHCDGVIYGVTQLPHILECKSANKNKFETFRKNGVKATYPQYHAQCQCYMGYSGLERALVVVYCKDNAQIYTERIHFNKHDFETYNNKAFDIITSNDPPKKTLKQDSMECQWCDYSIPCWSPGEAIVMASDKTCGTCHYFEWHGLKKCCTHPDHPYFLNIYGMVCPDYSYMWEKAWPGHTVNRPDAVGIDQVTEAPSA